MRAAFSETRDRKPDIRQGGGDLARKYAVGKDPLEKEESIPRIQPLNPNEYRRINKLLKRLIKRTTDPAERAGLLLHKAQLKAEQIKGVVHQEFLRDFWAWLMGTGKQMDHDKTFWGRQRLTDDPEVKAYCSAFVTKMWDFRVKLTLLATRRPVGINECLLYFKYIVRGEKPDSSHFLDDWSLFMQEYTMAREAGQDWRDPEQYIYPHETAPYGDERKKIANEKEHKDCIEAPRIDSDDDTSCDDNGGKRPPPGAPKGNQPGGKRGGGSTDDDDDDDDDGGPQPRPDDISFDDDEDDDPKPPYDYDQLADAVAKALQPLIEEIRGNPPPPSPGGFVDVIREEPPTNPPQENLPSDNQPPPPPDRAAVDELIRENNFRAAERKLEEQQALYTERLQQLDARIEELKKTKENPSVPSAEVEQTLKNIEQQQETIQDYLKTVADETKQLTQQRLEEEQRQTELLQRVVGQLEQRNRADHELRVALERQSNALQNLSRNFENGITIEAEVGPVVDRINQLEATLSNASASNPSYENLLRTVEVRQQVIEGNVLKAMNQNQSVQENLVRFQQESEVRAEQQRKKDEEFMANVVRHLEESNQKALQGHAVSSAKQIAEAVKELKGLNSDQMSAVIDELKHVAKLANHNGPTLARIEPTATDSPVVQSVLKELAGEREKTKDLTKQVNQQAQEILQTNTELSRLQQTLRENEKAKALLSRQAKKKSEEDKKAMQNLESKIAVLEREVSHRKDTLFSTGMDHRQNKQDLAEQVQLAKPEIKQVFDAAKENLDSVVIQTDNIVKQVKIAPYPTPEQGVRKAQRAEVARIARQLQDEEFEEQEKRELVQKLKDEEFMEKLKQARAERRANKERLSKIAGPISQEKAVLKHQKAAQDIENRNKEEEKFKAERRKEKEAEAQGQKMQAEAAQARRERRARIEQQEQEEAQKIEQAKVAEHQTIMVESERELMMQIAEDLQEEIEHYNGLEEIRRQEEEEEAEKYSALEQEEVEKGQALIDQEISYLTSILDSMEQAEQQETVQEIQTLQQVRRNPARAKRFAGKYQKVQGKSEKGSARTKNAIKPWTPGGGGGTRGPSGKAKGRNAPRQKKKPSPAQTDEEEEEATPMKTAESKRTREVREEQEIEAPVVEEQEQEEVPVEEQQELLTTDSGVEIVTFLQELNAEMNAMDEEEYTEEEEQLEPLLQEIAALATKNNIPVDFIPNVATRENIIRASYKLASRVLEEKNNLNKKRKKDE